VAYWLLAGRLVFPDARGMGQLIAHAQDVPESIADHVDLPGELTDLVMACLEKDPAKRPSSMAVVQRRLRDTSLAERWTRTHSHEWWSDIDLPALVEPEGRLDSSDPALLATLEAPSEG
jgi:serine/threonine protein kinase